MKTIIEKTANDGSMKGKFIVGGKMRVHEEAIDIFQKLGIRRMD